MRTAAVSGANGARILLRLSLHLAAILGLLLAAAATPAAASGTFRYSESRDIGRGGSTMIKFRRADYESIRPASAYRKDTVLRYSKRLGSTGLEFRVKVPLKPRRLLKVELRF